MLAYNLDWSLYKSNHPYKKDKLFTVPFLMGDFYSAIDANGVEQSMGVFEHRGSKVFRAWGVKSEVNCSAHALTFDNGETWTDPIYTCPEIDLVKDNKNNIIGFAIMYNFKVYRYTDSNIPEVIDIDKYTPSDNSLKENIIIYRPLILAALISVLLGSVLTYTHAIGHSYTMNIMGVFITLIGLLKFKNKKSFETMFRSYDPLAKRVMMYAKVYPYIEVLLGLAVIFGILTITVNSLVVVIYSVTTYGIVWSLRNNEKLTCGCVGGDFNIPLSRVTIFENAVMILMATYSIYAL